MNIQNYSKCCSYLLGLLESYIYNLGTILRFYWIGVKLFKSKWAFLILTIFD